MYFECHYEVRMKKSIFGGPRILIIDGNLGRIEYVEYFLVRNQFQSDVLRADQVELEASKCEIDLVVTYAPIDPTQFTRREIPVLFMLSGESAEQEHADHGTPMVSYLTMSEGPEAMIEKINELLKRCA
jgi:hypothetical protein